MGYYLEKYVYPKGRNLLGDSPRWEGSIKMYVKEVECQAVDWIHLALHRHQWRDHVNTATNEIWVLAALILMLVLWVVSPYGLVGRCQGFKDTYRLHTQG
jgi:hypothetical protein